MVTLKSGVGTTIRTEDRDYLYFAGNNYLGLANHPALVQESISALQRYGVNVSASRQTTGTSELHLELEQLLAIFKSKQDAIVFASGYMGNKILLDTLADRYSALFIDSMAHASIRDGIPKGIRHVFFYDHCNPDHLGSLLKQHPTKRPLVITDGIFALTGEIAPLDQLYAIAQKHHAPLIVDDAHATGVLGRTGKGTPEHFGLEQAPNLYQSETLSKAFGSYGGFIAAEAAITQKIRNGSAFYGASTALPPAIVAAGCASVRLIQEHPELRQQLADNATQLRAGIRSLELETTDSVAPIIPLFFEHRETAENLSNFLETHHIIAPAVNYPVKMNRYIVRITVSASHTPEQIEKLITTLKNWKNNHECH
jgi:7-keto-8-aminopelargonate synthetase-like enzyme